MHRPAPRRPTCTRKRRAADSAPHSGYDLCYDIAQAPQPVSPYPRTCAPRNPIRRASYARRRAHVVRTRGVCAKPRRHAGAVRSGARCTRPVHRRHAAQHPNASVHTRAPAHHITPHVSCAPTYNSRSHTRRVRKAAPPCWCRPVRCSLHETGSPQTCCTSTRVAARAL